ncbi:MAG TPA: hypothetical protein PL044_06440 [Clostridiales bacterium]|nr:hypothetical protein [Clostridiales bacterium]HQH63054.1 hypothetical protein [Clostridiales bacterium]HQK73395.1 hypothetical protein [Clostridiales bacterium]
MDSVGKYEVRSEAKRINRQRQWLRILILGISSILLLLTVTFVCATFVNKAGRFTINLDPESLNKYGISIADNEDMKDATIVLRGTAVENITNITKKHILNNPSYKDTYFFYEKDDPTYKDYSDIDRVPGDHNGKNYIAYTFWIANSGSETVKYYGSLDIDSVAKGADEALRVMVFQNGKSTDYGKVPKNPDAQYATFGIDKYFLSGDVVMDVKRSDFKPGDKDRYTIVIWLEGWDPECVDNIKGGEVKLSMNFKVLEDETVKN